MKYVHGSLFLVSGYSLITTNATHIPQGYFIYAHPIALHGASAATLMKMGAKMTL